MVFHKRMTRATALIQATIGVISIALGTVDVLIVKSIVVFYIGMPIWLGVWAIPKLHKDLLRLFATLQIRFCTPVVIFTGSLGVILTANKYPARKQWLLGSFLGFSLASSALAGFVTYLYMPLLVDYVHNRPGARASTKTSTLVCAAVIAVLAVTEVFVGIWSALCCSRGCYFCGGSPRALDVSSHAAYLGMATQDAMASGSHVLVEVPGAPPAVVPVQIVEDVDSNDKPLSESKVLY